MTERVAAPAPARPIEFPPGVDAAAVVRPMLHTAYWRADAQGAALRRHACRHDPVVFALTYLRHHLRLPDTQTVSFARFHLDLARAALRWERPEPARDIWIAPRGAGKTRWLFCILPLWALAFGHRRFVLCLAHTAEQAVGHLAGLRQELAGNPLLRHDFAELAPRKVAGARHTAKIVNLTQGTVLAGGLGETLLGVSAGAARPDLIIGDDLEPAEAEYSPQIKEKLRSKLINAVLRMGTRHTAVQLTGTVTMPGSLIHDAVREAKGEGTAESSWVRAKGFAVHWYRPFDERGESMWPQRWSVEDLRADEAGDPREWAMNMLNDPPDGPHDGTVWWTREIFRHDEHFPTVRRVIHIDPAVTRPSRGRRDSDYTVLAMVGVDATGQRACVERVEWGHWTLDEIRRMVWSFAEPLRIKPAIRVEGNQGGDTWLDSLAPWPPGVDDVRIVHAREAKDLRIARAHNHYRRRAVWHGYPDVELERVMCEWPRGRHDDVVDAVAGALAWAFPPA